MPCKDMMLPQNRVAQYYIHWQAVYHCETARYSIKQTRVLREPYCRKYPSYSIDCMSIPECDGYLIPRASINMVSSCISIKPRHHIGACSFVWHGYCFQRIVSTRQVNLQTSPSIASNACRSRNRSRRWYLRRRQSTMKRSE